MKIRHYCCALCSLVVLVLVVGSQWSFAQNYFSDWPANTSPKEVGKRLAENFAKRDFEFQSGKRKFVIYPEACAWYGALNVSKEVKDRDLTKRLTTKFDRFLTPDGAQNISQQAHVDYRVFGIVPLELYIQTKSKPYLTIGHNLADQQWTKTTDDGITAEARYWID